MFGNSQDSFLNIYDDNNSFDMLPNDDINNNTELLSTNVIDNRNQREVQLLDNPNIINQVVNPLPNIINSGATPSGRFRRWQLTFFYDKEVQTINDHGVQRLESVEECDKRIINKLKDGVRHHMILYFISGMEKCPTTGRLHRHIYLRLPHTYGISYLKKVTGLKKAHCEKCNGTELQNINYVKKDNYRVVEMGAKIQQGKRNDIEDVAEAIKEGLTVKELAEEYTGMFIKYSKGIKETYNILNEVSVKPKPMVYLYFGTAGSGKSFDAKKDCTSADYFIYTTGNNGTNWWDGYDPIQHKRVIIDEINGSYFKPDKLKQILGEDPIRVEVKGGSVAFVPEQIYVLSNTNPVQWYKSLRLEDLCAIIRRFNIYVTTKTGMIKLKKMVELKRL